MAVDLPVSNFQLQCSWHPPSSEAGPRLLSLSLLLAPLHMYLPPIMLPPTPGLASALSSFPQILFPTEAFQQPDNVGSYPAPSPFPCRQFHVFRERAVLKPLCLVLWSDSATMCEWHSPPIPVASCENPGSLRHLALQW